MKLSQKFYSRDTTRVAQELIGKILCRKFPDGLIVKTIITETEAYLGITDRACHTFGGRRTPRTEVMWGAPGRAYVYFIYGMYFCLNAVTQKFGIPEAVLIRGAIPLDTKSSVKNWIKIEPHMKKWRRIMSGPGRLCNVLKIDKTLNGLPLQSSDLWIEDGFEVPAKEIVKSPRIGIDYTLNDPAGSHQWPLRFLWTPVAELGRSEKIKKQESSSYENIFRHYENNRQNTSRKNAKDRKRPSR